MIPNNEKRISKILLSFQRTQYDFLQKKITFSDWNSNSKNELKKKQSTKTWPLTKIIIKNLTSYQRTQKKHSLSKKHLSDLEFESKKKYRLQTKNKTCPKLQKRSQSTHTFSSSFFTAAAAARYKIINDG